MKKKTGAKLRPDNESVEKTIAFPLKNVKIAKIKHNKYELLYQILDAMLDFFDSYTFIFFFVIYIKI